MRNFLLCNYVSKQEDRFKIRRQIKEAVNGLTLCPAFATRGALMCAKRKFLVASSFDRLLSKLQKGTPVSSLRGI